MTQGCAGNCNQGRASCDCMRWDGTSRPAPMDEVVNGRTERRSIPGAGIVRAVGIVALLAVLANVTWHWVRP